MTRFARPLGSSTLPVFFPTSRSPLRALPAIFLGGVLTSLTPCIYPMIPITAAIVGGTSVGEGQPVQRAAAVASGAPHPHLRVRTRVGLLGARPVRRA